MMLLEATPTGQDRSVRQAGLSVPTTASIATAAAILLGCLGRIVTGAHEPLWLDETFTGAIAAQPSLTEVIRQILLDVNAPGYYLIAHAWSLIAGLSDEALRLPALVFSLATPFLCLLPFAGLERRTRLSSCAMIALWAPGFLYAQEARGYSLLLLLSLAGTIQFIRLLEAPTLRRSFVWAALGCAAILTHYHAVVLFGLQGLAYLFILKGRAVRTWPATLLFLPVFAWIGVHSGRIATFAAPDVAWYGVVRVADLIDILEFATGSWCIALLLVPLAGGLVYTLSRPAAKPVAPERTAWIAAACAMAGAVFVVVLGFYRPSFTFRYLIPFVPGLLLGIALCAERVRSVWAPTSAVVLLFFFSTAAAAFFDTSAVWKTYNFEGASKELEAAGTRRLVFFWDHPATVFEDPRQLDIVGGFFFRRDHKAIDVIPLRVARHEDPNPRLLALADKPDTAILWLYDRHVHDTAAREFPPRIAAPGSGWTCRDSGGGSIGIFACTKAKT